VLALRARFDEEAAHGLTESYEFRLEGDGVVRFDVVDGEGEAAMGPARNPAVVIEADSETLAALTGGAINGPEAVGRGARIEGKAAAIERMGRVLPGRRGGLARVRAEEPVPA
jgi:hypothetical protein